MLKRFGRISDDPIGDSDRSEEGRGHVALITGASAGIGRSFSELLAAKGYDVIAVARRMDRLSSLQAELETRWRVNVHPVTADLGNPETPRRLLHEANTRGLTVDVLVNNAGYTAPACWFHEASWEDKEHFLRVAGLSVIELTHHFLPGMVHARWGRIINVGSLSAHFTASPSAVLYAGTKAMVQKFSEGIAAECAESGVNCTISMPGATDTELFSAAGLEESAKSNLIVRSAMMSPNRVAREAYEAVMTGRRSVLHGRHHQLVGALLRHSPLRVQRRISWNMMKPMGLDTLTTS